jgi:dTDP-glucose 4,6-dehydratase
MSKSQNNPFALPGPDLAHMLRHAGAELRDLRGAHLFITGGTGFFGKWLLGALCHAHAELNLGLHLTVLSRDPAAFQKQYPLIEKIPGLNFIAGDVAQVSLSQPRFDYVLHAATDTTAFTDEAQERERSRAIVAGTRRILELTKFSGARRLLNISSGAVYGSYAAQSEGASEDDYPAAQPITAYALAKREAEQLCADSGLDFVTARAFAFLGPHLPIDAHFAAGNFLRDAKRGGPILVRGDGTALRSYLYPADLVIWLLRILLRGQNSRAYNIGSNEKVSTAQLAQRIAEIVEPRVEVTIQSLQPQGPQNIYLPNVQRARTELNLDLLVPLDDAIRRTLEFLSTTS